MTQTVYILEDEPATARIMSRALEEYGLATRAFRRRADFQREATRQRPDLCLIDLTLPDGDGLEIVGSFLRTAEIPTIIVTGREGLSDRVLGLEMGADDYIAKPFEPRELVARVRSLLRRSRPREAAPDGRIATFDGWTADFDACELHAPDGSVQRLSAAETRLLRSFVSAAGRVLSRGRLLELDNPDALEPDDRSIDARISRLRRKLGDDPKSPRIIRTVYGAGYLFALKPVWS
jgi:DNA-binding response OmpR family regulator